MAVYAKGRLSALMLAVGMIGIAHGQSSRPNVLWITCEDMGPRLGAYGDAYATTPNLDHFAMQGLRYLNVWSNAPVCAPARTALISGVYPTASGSEHMRSMTQLPRHMKLFPQFLREAGYYCTNNVKEDYNLEKPGRVWDESSPRAHWRNRGPSQPFFAVFNLTVTHESGVHRRSENLIHDPAKAPLPAYHPEHPSVRQDWAQVYDNISRMDGEFGKRLRELEEAGLADDTIVFFYSDHGTGMPRQKRWPYNCGLAVPLIIRIPAKFRRLAPDDYDVGGTTNRLVSFVDFAPTMLNLAGLRPPKYFHGRAFLGRPAGPPNRYLHGFRGRMDERYDLVRSVRDDRFVYIRNYMPHKPYGQYLQYMFLTETTRVWHRLFASGALRPPQTAFWQPKPSEELYDLRTDPDEVYNLALSPAHREILSRLRQVQQQHILEIRDVGFLPEDEIHRRSRGMTPFEMRHDDRLYPLERIVATAEKAAQRDQSTLPDLLAACKDDDSAVRYWAIMGILIRGAQAARQASPVLSTALRDESPSVRVVAAETLGRFGAAPEVQKAVAALLELASAERNGVYVSIAALNALDELDHKAAPGLNVIRAAAAEAAQAPERVRQMPKRLVEKIVADLENP
jgi:uncharacterized sulfatase